MRAEYAIESVEAQTAGPTKAETRLVFRKSANLSVSFNEKMWMLLLLITPLTKSPADHAGDHALAYCWNCIAQYVQFNKLVGSKIQIRAVIVFVCDCKCDVVVACAPCTSYLYLSLISSTRSRGG
ncbi:hypothetical protein DAI22_05g065200 [Oryza sativa Japonica Group]|jgi:hypothetical protein|nr:hypothetical protein DAI22_05g065200 [Oryza sativa Japonica Group]